jgi:hypothetical protein
VNSDAFRSSLRGGQIGLLASTRSQSYALGRAAVTQLRVPKMRSFLRLDSLSPSLGRSFRKANDDQRRRATLEACIFAISQTGLESEHIDSAIDYLLHGGSYPLAVRRKLEALTTQLDEEYFKLSEAADRVTREAAVLFRRARAAAALAVSLSPSAEQLHEAIYEAINACSDMDEAKLITEKALR